MFKSMLKNKRFLPLLVPHFLSAVNDNFIRIVFLFFTTYKMAQQSLLLSISTVILFALSFCFASVYAGQFVDKYAKTKVLQAVRVFEVFVMLMALVSLSLSSEWLLALIIASLGFVSAVLRVADYSILPVLVDKEDLNGGNIWLKMSTAVGSICATLLLTSVLKFDAAYYVVCMVAFALSVISFLITLKLPRTAPAEPELKLTKSPTAVFEYVARKLKNNFDVWTYIIGVAWFWLLACVVMTFSAEYGRDILNARWSVVVFLSGVFSLGYILASFLYARVSRKNNMGAWTALVSFLMSVILFDLVLASSGLPAPTDKAITVAKMFTTIYL